MALFSEDPTDHKTRAKGLAAPAISQGLERVWDSGFCAGLMILSQQIRDNEKNTAALERVQERIQELIGSMS